MSRNRHSIPVWLTVILLGLSAGQPLLAQTDNQPVLDTVVAASDSESVADGEQTDTDQPAAAEPDTTVYRSVPDSVIARLKKQKEFAYANDPDYWKKEEEKKRSTASRDFFEWLFTSKAVRFIAYFILAFVLLYAIYKIITNNNLFYNPARKKTAAAQEVKEEINKDQLDERIAAAVQEQDYRKAVRWYFLKTLFDLDARGLIRYHPEGTNNEYMMQLGSHARAGEFSYLTQVYEYVWYGGFSLESGQFASVEQRFRQFMKSKPS